MKKRIVNALVTGLMVVSLAGCGTKTEVTGQEIPESGSAVESEAEADGSFADESTSEEVIGDNADEPSDFVGAENESIVLYAERGEHDCGSLAGSEFSSKNGVIMATTDIPVHDIEGYTVGHIKSGATIEVAEYSTDGWTRFENLIAGTDYDYLYVTRDYVTDKGNFTLTTTDAEEMIKESLGNRNFDAPVFTSVTNDMDVYEFRIPMYYDDSEMDRPINRIYSYYAKAEISILSYKTYSVVCTEDTDNYIICQIYYKDLITDEEFNSYGL